MSAQGIIIEDRLDDTRNASGDDGWGPGRGGC